MMNAAVIIHIRATAQVIMSFILKHLSDLLSQPLNHLKYDPINYWRPQTFENQLYVSMLTKEL